MKRWIVAGVGVLCAGACAGLWLARSEPNPTASRPAAPIVAEPATPAAPAPAVVLAEVVEVADLELLLDPRSKGGGGTPFDADVPAAVPVSAPAAPPVIPPAAHDEPAADVAAMPHEVSAAPPLDPSRACWYGGDRLPRQVGGGLTHDEMLRQLRDTLWRLRPRHVPSGVDVGVGVYF